MAEQRDYTGQRFNRLTGIRPEGRKMRCGSWNRTWLWQCDCGNTVEEIPILVGRGNRKSCGCLREEVRRNNITPCQRGERRKPIADMAGQRFNRLVALYPLEERRNGRVYWMFKCDCGNEKAIEGRQVRAGKTCSCGCKLKEAAGRNAEYGRQVRSAMVAAKRSRLACGLIPALMPTIKPRGTRLVSIMGTDE